MLKNKQRTYQVMLVVKNLPTMQETSDTRVRSLSPDDPQEEGMATHSSFPAWRILPGQRDLVGYHLWACEELNTTEVT